MFASGYIPMCILVFPGISNRLAPFCNIPFYFHSFLFLRREPPPAGVLLIKVTFHGYAVLFLELFESPLRGFIPVPPRHELAARRQVLCLMFFHECDSPAFQIERGIQVIMCTIVSDSRPYLALRLALSHFRAPDIQSGASNFLYHYHFLFRLCQVTAFLPDLCG